MQNDVEQFLQLHQRVEMDLSASFDTVGAFTQGDPFNFRHAECSAKGGSELQWHYISKKCPVAGIH